MGFDYFDFSSSGRSSGGSYGGLTKGEWQLLKEEKQQQWRAYDIEIEDIKINQKLVEKDIELVNLESLEIGLQIAETNRDMKGVDLQVAEINLQAHELDIDIAQERLTQKEDELSYEQFNTQVKREGYIISANTAIAQLEAASQELEELLDHNQLKYVEYNPNLNQLNFSGTLMA